MYTFKTSEDRNTTAKIGVYGPLLLPPCLLVNILKNTCNNQCKPCEWAYIYVHIGLDRQLNGLVSTGMKIATM